MLAVSTQGRDDAAPTSDVDRREHRVEEHCRDDDNRNVFHLARDIRRQRRRSIYHQHERALPT